ncbi:MAG: cell division topological specificity factor MinE [Pseudomonadota bacterium]
MFRFFRREPQSNSADTAKDRLRILLAHERKARVSLEVLPLLQRDIMEAIEKRLEVGRDSVDIRIARAEDLSTLEINIELPNANAMVA